jgi:hypothetical protein
MCERTAVKDAKCQQRPQLGWTSVGVSLFTLCQEHELLCGQNDPLESNPPLLLFWSGGWYLGLHGLLRLHPWMLLAPQATGGPHHRPFIGSWTTEEGIGMLLTHVALVHIRKRHLQWRPPYLGHGLASGTRGDSSPLPDVYVQGLGGG